MAEGSACAGFEYKIAAAITDSEAMPKSHKIGDRLSFMGPSFFLLLTLPNKIAADLRTLTSSQTDDLYIEHTGQHIVQGKLCTTS